MRIYIFARDLRTARYLAETLYLKAWSFIEGAYALHGVDGFVVLREIDSCREHPDYPLIEGHLNTLTRRESIVSWDVSLNWLVRHR